MGSVSVQARAGKAGRGQRMIGWVPGSWNPKHGSGILRIDQAGKSEFYFVGLMPHPDPNEAKYGFSFQKLEPLGATYSVLLSPEDGKHSCECPGWLRWNKCKHVAGLLALAAAGRFPPAKPERKAA